MSEAQSRVHDLLANLHRRQAIVLGALLLIAVAAYQAQNSIITHLFDDGALINLAGRQRMLSQRGVAFALQMASSDSPDERRLFSDLLARVGSEMAEGHRRLIDETTRRGMSANMRALYFGASPSLDSEIAAFVAQIDDLAASREMERNTPRLRAFADKSRLSLLPGLEQVVVQYQVESRGHVSRLQRNFTIGLGTMAGILIFSWFGVFRPMARRLQEELVAHQAAVERNRLILESMGEGIIGLDRGGRATFINRAAAETLGYGADELLGHRLHPMVHHTRADGSLYPIEDCPLAETLADGKGRSVVGELFWHKDGSSFPVHYASTPIVSGEARIGAVVTFRDISTEMATKRALEASEQVKSSILDAALDAIVTIDRDGLVVEFNPAAERIFGYSASAAMGREIAELIIPEANREAHRRGLERMAAGGGSAMIGQRLEMTGLHSSGREMPVELTVTHLPNHGLFTAFIRDLSEQKLTEAALRRSQKMEVVGQLTGGIAHDFNNLLGIISGNLELLAKTVAGDETGTRRLATALKTAQRGADLTRRLLSFSRQDSGAQGKTQTDVNECISGMLEMLQRLLTQRIDIHSTLSPGLWPTKINRNEFEDSLLNLALNARDAMPDGGSLVIETANIVFGPEYHRIDPNLAPGRYVSVAIGDTGTGISKELIERVFEPFFTTKDRGKGTGLGLAMVYGFVRRSGGHVRVYSEPGRGTTFRLYLPKAVERAEGPASPDEESDGPLPTGNETILVVDDEPHLAEIAGEFLRDLGYTSIVCTDAGEALSILQARQDVALLFTDVVMPNGLDGFMLQHRVDELGLACKVLLTSGFTGFAAGADGGKAADVLMKPYDKATLARRVRQVLNEGRPA